MIIITQTFSVTCTVAIVNLKFFTLLYKSTQSKHNINPNNIIVDKNTFLIFFTPLQFCKKYWFFYFSLFLTQKYIWNTKYLIGYFSLKSTEIRKSLLNKILSPSSHKMKWILRLAHSLLVLIYIRQRPITSRLKRREQPITSIAFPDPANPRTMIGPDHSSSIQR